MVHLAAAWTCQNLDPAKADGAEGTASWLVVLSLKREGAPGGPHMKWQQGPAAEQPPRGVGWPGGFWLHRSSCVRPVAAT